MCPNGENLSDLFQSSVKGRYMATSTVRAIAMLFGASLPLASGARAADSVDLTLVLVSDVSRSIDDFRVQA